MSSDSSSSDGAVQKEKSRIALNAWFRSIKNGREPGEALESAEITDLDEAIVTSGWLPEDEESDGDTITESDREDESEDEEGDDQSTEKEEEIEKEEKVVDGNQGGNETSDDDEAVIKELINDVLNKICGDGADGSVDDVQREKNSSGGPITAPESSIKKVEITNVDIQMDEIEPENPLVSGIGSVLEEAEYCAHAMLLAAGKVLVDQKGQLDTKMFWAAQCRKFVTDGDHPVEEAEKRLKAALDTLGRLLACKSVRSSSHPWKYRYLFLCDIVRALPNNKSLASMLKSVGEIRAANMSTNPSIKPYSDTVSGENHALYLVKNGLPGYLDAMDHLIGQMTGTHWNLGIMTTLHEVSEMICTAQQILPMVENLAAAKRITDIRVSKSFVKLFKAAFQNLDFDEKLLIMDAFYKKNGPVAWHESTDEFGTGLTAALLELSQWTQDGDQSMREWGDKFAWYFMNSIKYTWWRLLLPSNESNPTQTAMTNPKMIRRIIELIRCLPPVRNLLGATGERLILAGVRAMVKEGGVKTDEFENNWIHLLRALVCETTSVKKEGDSMVVNTIAPIVDRAEEGVGTVVLPLIESNNPRIGLRAMMELLDTSTPIKWSGDAPVSDEADAAEKWNERGGINAAKLLTTILELGEKQKKGTALDWAITVKLCNDVVSCLVLEWRASGLRLTSEASRWLKRRFESCPQDVRDSLSMITYQLVNKNRGKAVSSSMITTELPDDMDHVSKEEYGKVLSDLRNAEAKADEYKSELEKYKKLHDGCKKNIDTGSTGQSSGDETGEDKEMYKATGVLIEALNTERDKNAKLEEVKRSLEEELEKYKVDSKEGVDIPEGAVNGSVDDE